MDECPVNRCNQSEGHKGPHGVAVAGLVLGPFGQTGKGRKCDELTDVICDSCNKSPLKITWRNENDIGGILRCTGCDQEHVINADGTGSCILKTLYPSSWERGCKQWPEFLEGRKESAIHKSLMCEWLDVDYDIKDFLDAVDVELKEHNKLVNSMPLWKKLWERIK